MGYTESAGKSALSQADSFAEALRLLKSTPQPSAAKQPQLPTAESMAAELQWKEQRRLEREQMQNEREARREEKTRARLEKTQADRTKRLEQLQRDRIAKREDDV
jgi:hypothetical protein